MIVSIMVPMLNEEAWIEGLLANIDAQTYAGELEVLVADGGSTDRSVELLRHAAARHELSLRLLENPGRLIPHGLNACIRQARGDLVVRMDCHARYPPDYVQRCVAAIAETSAWNVGGQPVSVGKTSTERAAACATDSPFGGIHWTREATALGRVEVDTVYCGAFRRQVFARVGLFDESLPRNEDEDMNFRIRRAGGRVMLDTGIKVLYTPKGSAAELFARYRGYGEGKVDLMRKHRRPMTVRSLAPLAFVGSLSAFGLASVTSRRARWVARAEVSVYTVGALAFGLREIARRGEPMWLLPRVIAIFPLIHVGYGLGMLRGFWRLAVRATMSR